MANTLSDPNTDLASGCCPCSPELEVELKMLGALSSTFGLDSSEKEEVGFDIVEFASAFVSDGLLKDAKGFWLVVGGCEAKGDCLIGCAGAPEEFEVFVANGEAVLDYTLATCEELGSAECRSLRQGGARRDMMRGRNRFSNP